MSLLAVLILAAAACTSEAAAPDPQPGSTAASTTTTEPPPPMLLVAVRDQGGAPVAGASLELGGTGTQVTADGDGRAQLAWPGGPAALAVSAPGYHSTTIEVEELPGGLRVPVTLAARTAGGQVITAGGTPLAGATVALGSQTAVTGPDGGFELVRADGELLRVSRPAYLPVEVAWDGGVDPVVVELTPRIVRSLRASGFAAGDPAVWDGLMELAETTEINAVVVDTKAEGGTVYFDTEVALAHDIGAVDARYDVEAVIDDLSNRNLYAITRIVTFQDHPVGQARPELAVWDTGRAAPWRTVGGQTWLDPTDRRAWEYPLALAVDACSRGFDEIQFDYVRFPSDGPVDRARYDGPAGAADRVATIADFLTEARDRLHPLGCAVSADVFGIIVSVADDQGIGQTVEQVGAAVDVLSPMVYASHYSTGWFGYACPSEHQAEVVAGALDDTLARLAPPTVVRPWIEDFSYVSPGLAAVGCSSPRSAATVRGQIEAAEERGSGWMLWNAAASFTGGALAEPRPQPFVLDRNEHLDDGPPGPAGG